MQTTRGARVTEPPVRAQDRVYEAMKEEIITGQLLPGSIISELMLAQRYQTSRTPVREACQSLQKDGLLEVVPHKGFFVAEITMKQVQDIHQLRRLLEGSCARIAAEKITPTELQDLEALARPITYTASNQRHSSELNRRFHLKIAEITGNQEIIRILANILDKISRSHYLETKKASPIIDPEHQEIVRAIKMHDPDAAEKAMVAHIQISLDRRLDVISGKVPL